MKEEIGEVVVTRFREVVRRPEVDGLGSCALCRTKQGRVRGAGCRMWHLVKPDSLSHPCIWSQIPKPQALEAGGGVSSKKM